MKNYLFLSLLLCTQFLFGQQNENALPGGERQRIHSQFLQEDRPFQIYLPPSYFFNEAGNYPVIYLIDGDYNFHYNTGLIEFLSSVSGRIPEMIVVGIADKGNAKYRINCTPTGTSEQAGNASNFMAFIEKELKPYIQQNYRASDYEILIGHSLGGLFTTNYFLQQPDAFNYYIAIDPSLWWGDFEITERADSIFKDKKTLDASLFLSLANTKGMGVRQFVGVLDKHFPESDQWTFKHYDNENHGSVGLPTVKDALELLFKDWEVDRAQFYRFKSVLEVSEHYQQLADRFSTSFALPSSFLSQIIYYYHRENKAELTVLESEIKQHFPRSLEDYYNQVASNYFDKGDADTAATLYKKRLAENPLSFQSCVGLSKIYYAQKDYERAKEMSSRAVQIGRQVKVRQWLLNELHSNEEKINVAMKK